MGGDSLRLILVTTGEGSAERTLSICRAALDGGATTIWLRERERDENDLRRLVGSLRDVAESRKAKLVISGRVDLALEYGLHGVHFGQRDPSLLSVVRPERSLTFSYSAHAPLDVTTRASIGAADYVTLSPLFDTPSKVGLVETLGAARFEELARTIPRPVVALGGIDAQGVPVAIEAGAVGVCVMRAIFAADDPFAAAGSLRRAVDGALPR